MRLALAFLAACTPYSISGPTTPPPVAASADVGTICVIRSSPFARAVTFIVHDNQTLVGATRATATSATRPSPATT